MSRCVRHDWGREVAGQARPSRLQSTRSYRMSEHSIIVTSHEPSTLGFLVRSLAFCEPNRQSAHRNPYLRGLRSPGARAAAATCIIPASHGRYARLGGAGLCDARSRTDEGVLLAKQIWRDACIAIRATPRLNSSASYTCPLTWEDPVKDPPHEWARLVLIRFLSAGNCRLLPKKSAAT